MDIPVVLPPKQLFDMRCAVAFAVLFAVAYGIDYGLHNLAPAAVDAAAIRIPKKGERKQEFQNLPNLVIDDLPDLVVDESDEDIEEPKTPIGY